jgi:hypothetical protein
MLEVARSKPVGSAINFIIISLLRVTLRVALFSFRRLLPKRNTRIFTRHAIHLILTLFRRFFILFYRKVFEAFY